MKKIRIYATTANLGSGFDVLGMALNIYNEYEFEVSDSYKLDNFDSRYNNENNLIIKSYKATFAYLNKKDLPLHLMELTNNIPTSRGLGSSASCIICGIKIANYLNNNILSEEEMLNLATKIEGHPDNVCPAIYGGLQASIVSDNDIKNIRLDIHEDLRFTICIPNFELETEMARNVLPKEIKLGDATYNLSRIVSLIKGFEKGDLDLIKEGIKDKLHVNYRLNLIPQSQKLIEHFPDIAITISGAGPTLLAISKENVSKSIGAFLGPDWSILEVKPQDKGVTIYA